MTRIRSKRQRYVAFEALEGRLALSTGMAASAAADHGGLAHVNSTQKSIKAKFTGRVQINGTSITSNNLKGTIGPDHFTGTGQVTDLDGHFQDGTVNLHNGKGTVVFSLVPGNFVKVGKSMQQQVELVVVGATGKYAPYLNATGTVTKWNVPARQNATTTLQATIPV